MEHGWKLVVICLFFQIGIGPVTSELHCPERKAVICYWASWSIYRPVNGNLLISDIHPEFCTHLVYTFAGLSIEGKIVSMDPDLDIRNHGYKKFIALKEKDPCLKVLLAIGGWGEGSEKYSLMVESEKNRETFVESVLRLLIFHGFDGIDIDWEFPTQRGGLPSDRDNFTELLKLLRLKLAPRNRLVTAAVTASLEGTKLAYDVQSICKELDYVSLMGYDFHDLNVTSIHAPLEAELGENRSTIADTVNYYRENGCPGNKIILGVPAYGRSYTLKNAKNTKVGAPILKVGKAGHYTGEAGYLGFNEICEMQTIQKGWSKEYLKENAAVYAYNDKMWVSYDDERTVMQKANYVLGEGLGGMMMWSIDTDDFRGICANITHPLLHAINKGLNWNLKK